MRRFVWPVAEYLEASRPVKAPFHFLSFQQFALRPFGIAPGSMASKMPLHIMGYASEKLQFGHPLRCIRKIHSWKTECLILALAVVAVCAFAQQPEPTWLSQIRLSGLNGPADNRLAIINDRTFSAGEEADLKLKGRTVHVKCVEIREQSVLIKIEDLPTPYELTISGSIAAVGNNPVIVAPPQVPPKVEIPAQVPPPQITVPSIPSQPVIHPRANTSTFPTGTIMFCAGIFLALLVGIGLGARVTHFQHRRNIGEAFSRKPSSGISPTRICS